ncbi:MAG: hypothetical protein WC058_14795 [Phycisphaeraceae bacterium]
MWVVRIILFTLIAGYLCGFLLKVVRQGLRSGAIGYIDSTRKCERDKQPLGYWALVIFFSALAAVIAATWVWAAGEYLSSPDRVSEIAPDSLIGQDEAGVVAVLGKPEFRDTWGVSSKQLEPEGPTPGHMQEGDTYISLFYPDIRGQQWSVFLASPEIYERLHGNRPPGEGLRVIEIHTDPKGLVY